MTIVPQSSQPAPNGAAAPRPEGARRPEFKLRLLQTPAGFLARLRIRKKLIVLHTFFTLGLAGVLLALERPAANEIVMRAEIDGAKAALHAAVLADRTGDPAPTVNADAMIREGEPEGLGISAEDAARAAASPDVPIHAPSPGHEARVIVFVPGAPDVQARYRVAEVRIAEARAAVMRLYGLTAAALLAVYALVALALEFFVLPQHVYAPIKRMLDAERAVQDGRPQDELIPEHAIPADELGEIMRSRNGSIVSLRRNQAALAEALDRLEEVANDLKKKNHLLEAARRNLADADRLASLGMMSAGIAHELNTPLTVLKGLVERLDADPRAGLDKETSALMVRVVGRLERLGESLLDFARVRPAEWRSAELRAIVEEAATLVRLDRDARDVRLANDVPDGVILSCDSDRVVQVLVNLLRNGVDAVRRGPADGEPVPMRNGVRGEVRVSSERAIKDGRDWVTVSVADDGPGIDPEVLPRLFEPFVSTKLDSRGTGLGLAVADGIVREHGGMIVARNRPGKGGSVFEVVLPVSAGSTLAPHPD